MLFLNVHNSINVYLDGESVNTFITAFYTLAEHCEYGVLHDELIRDRIVVGIRDKNLSGKLQLDAYLTLTKVIEGVRLSEVIKEQQEKLIEKDSESVNAISPNKPAKFLKQKPSSEARKQSVKPDFHRKNNENESRLPGKCKWCGKQRHDKRVCPARDARCRQCSKIGHYAKFCITKPQTGCSEVAYLNVIQLESKNKTNIDWTVTVQEALQEAAFQKLMKILSSDPVLMIFDPGKETIATTDASSYGLGATICQKQADGRRSVIAYASRTLTPTESRYAQIEKEALAVVRGCEKFRDYLTGMHFKID
ncbi:hypothetical protein AVEN_78523-1 [Araneus ventricosus]|uniref:Reverse transcriptase/retrotransposon-derived protein RNase H-like domain-containing protein n=1 Tax=Araneus ventricosus TaxID=182803 RepID=A0A4Y2ELR9_ARAVE|nr:hypothetical protein AVEN_78523-1 [Araneus ventricosus]